MNVVLKEHNLHNQNTLPSFYKVTLVSIMFWLILVAGVGWWISQTIVRAEVDNLADSAQYEANTTAHVMDRVFTEMSSIANMMAGHADVIQLAARYRTDPPSFANMTRQ